MNFVELKKSVAEWSWKDNVDSTIPTLIQWAQDELERLLKLRAMEKIANVDSEDVALTIPEGVDNIDLPSDYISLNYFVVFDGTIPYPITNRFFSGTLRAMGLNDLPDGRPTALTVIGDKIYFDRTADKDYTYEIGYMSKLTALSDDADSNWWTENASEAMLYLSLKKLAIMTKSYDEFARFTALADEQINNLKNADKSERASGPPLSIGQADGYANNDIWMEAV